MNSKTLFTLTVLAVIASTLALGSFSRTQRHGEEHRRFGKPGKPLDASHLLRSGRAKEVREASKVQPPIGPNDSYSGFFTTNTNKTNHMFWWYFPAQNGNPDAPLLIWLQGGPGGSSMFALFSEMGPLTLDANLNVLTNNFTWNREYGMIFIDNPVGAGFSYTDDDSGYCTNTKDCVASNLYSLLQQFYQAFPEQIKNDLYVTGESYGGHYVPGFTYYIHMKNQAGGNPTIPLKGLAVGDGWIDPVNMVMGYPDLMYNLGLADANQKAVIQDYCMRTHNYIVEGNMLAAFNVWDQMLNGDVFPYPNYFHNITGSNDYDNFLRTNSPASFGYYSRFLNQDSVKAAIHASGRPFPFNPTACEKHLLSDFMVSFQTELVTLLENYKVLIYSGQLDIIIGAPLTERFLPLVPWSGQSEYQSADRLIWKVEPTDSEVAGYVRSVKNFRQVVVRGAGHIVPYDQPRVSLDMITRFVENTAFEQA